MECRSFGRRGLPHESFDWSGVPNAAGESHRERGARVRRSLGTRDAATGITLLLVCLGAGCRDTVPAEYAPPEEHPLRGGSLRVLHEAPQSLDPVLADDVYELTVAHQMYEGLVLMGDNLEVRPGLAESWVVSEDGRRYTFRLRPGIRFHDGRPLDGACVVGSLLRALAPAKPTPCLAESYLEGIVGARDYLAGNANSIRGLSAPEPRVVEIELERPLTFFLAALTLDPAAIVPAEIGLDWQRLESQPVGTGPFRFVRRLPDGGVALARNDAYWGEPALLDSLIFVAAPPITAERVVSLLLRDRVDVAPVYSRDRRTLGDVAGYRLVEAPELSLTFLGVRTDLPPFDRVEVRRALQLCVSAQDLQGEGVLRAEGILPPGMPGYQPHADLWTLDLDLARVFLAEVGISAEQPAPPVTLSASHDTRASKWLREGVVPRLTALGLPIEIEELDWPELDARVMRGTAQLFTMTWVADVPDPDSFLYSMFRRGEPNNFFGFADAAVDSLLELGRSTPPGEERRALYRTVEARILDQAPLVPLYHATNAYAWRPDIAGVETSPLGFSVVPFDRIWFRPAGDVAEQRAEVLR